MFEITCRSVSFHFQNIYFESVTQTLIRFAMRMEQVLELRRRADRLDQQAFEYGDDTLDSIHTRQHLRHQAAQLRHQADADASHADAQASSEFQTIARMIPPSLIPGAEADAPDALLAGLPKHWQDYYSRHPELLAEEKVAPPLTADQIESHRRADAMTILILYHKQTQSLWLPDEDRTEAARVYCDQAYGKLSADDLENEIELIRAEEERNYLWQERIQNGAHGKELIQQEGYTEYAIKQYYQDGAFLGMAAAITAAGGFKRSKGQGEIPTIPEVTGKLDRDLTKSYVRDIEAKTGLKVHKNQIEHLKEALRNKNYEKLSPKETAKHRSKFTSSLKDKLIVEWEEKTNQKWPRYTAEVYDKNGEIARHIGQPYDAHHLIENNFGGPHEWWNIHPAKYPDEHQAGIHGKGSPSGQLFPRR